MNLKTVLVTGGAGYIGVHICVELLQAGYKVVVVDNLCNSTPVGLQRVKELTGKSLAFHEADIRDQTAMLAVFEQHKIDAVIHLAGLKAVGESVTLPLYYYDNNVSGTVAMLEVMRDHGVKRIVFSSSATVYGVPASLPVTEAFSLSPYNPYGRCKMFVEEILKDLFNSDDSWSITLLRYFNPVGAHVSGRIGEDPKGTPNNLMPYIAQVAVGQRERLSVFGGDYDTRDGTGVRDYIHVVDLAKGHDSALDKLAQGLGVAIYNLGTGQGYSVLEMVKAFEQASGKPVPYEIVDRRPGDIDEYYADPSLAEQELGWKAEHGLQQMCEDSWRWQSNNPRGYSD